MLSLRKNISRLLLCGFVGWFATGCDKNSVNEAARQSACRIQQYSAISQAKFYNRTSQINYTYDAPGNLTKTLTTYEQRPANGAVGNQTGTNTTTYAYSDDGFLATVTSQEVYLTVTNKTTREQITTTTSYSYTAGRLSGYTINRIGAYGITTKTVGTLTYNSVGAVATKTEINTSLVHDPAIAKEMPTESADITRLWTYQNNQLVDYVERIGSIEYRPLSVQNGVVTKIAGSNYEVRIMYDGLQRVVRQENYANGQLTEYYEQTWAEAKSSSGALPSFKGFPVGVQVTASEQSGVIATHKTFYWNSVARAMQPYSERTATVQTNVQEFITGAVITTTHPTAADQNVTTTETYTYTGCQ